MRGIFSFYFGRRDDAVNNNKLTALWDPITSKTVRTGQCEVGACLRGVGDGTRWPCRFPPAAWQGWRLLLWDHCLAYPNCSRASKIKTPWDPFAWAGKPCAVSASQTPLWHFHGWFFFPFVSFFYICLSVLTFREFSQLFPASLPVFFCISPIKVFFLLLLLLLPPCLLCCFSVFRSRSLWWQCTSQE